MANWWDDLEPAKPAAPSAAPWWADLEQNRETTGGEFVGGLMAQGARGIMRAGRDTLALAAKAGTAAPDAIRKLIGMEPIGPMLERQAGAFFEPGMQAATEMMPEAYQRELGREVIGQNEETGELEFSLPTGEQTVGTLVESLPQIPGMIAGGQGAAGLMARAFPKASQALGFGASNAATVSQGQYFDTLNEVRAQALADGATPAQADAKAEEAARIAQAGTAALSFGTGAAGMGLAAKLGQGASSRLAGAAKGFAADAPFEGVEETGQALIADAAAGRDLNTIDALNQGAIGLVAGGVPGAVIGGMQRPMPRTPAEAGSQAAEDALQQARARQPAATPAPAAAPPDAPLDDIPAESTTDLDAAIDAMLAPTTETAPDGRLGTPAPVAAPPVVGSSGLVDATAAAPDPAAGAVGDVAPETGRRPFLTPDDVAREQFTARAAAAGLSSEQIAQMTPDTLADDVTGFFDGRLKGVKSGTILRAQEHVEATGEPAFYVDGDIVNLGGLNKATGENMEAANAHYRAMTDILRAELESTGGDIVPLRTGGDEVGAVVVNAPEPAIRAAMTAANAKVRAYAQANGFGDIPHTKADRTDRGVGLHLGLAPIQPGASLSDIIEASSAEIAASKGGTPDVNGSQTERLGPVAPVGPAGSVGGSVAAEAQGAGGQDAARLGQAPSTQGDAQGVRAAPQVTPAEAPSAPTVTAPPPSARPAPKGRSTLRAIAKTIGLDLADFKRHGVDPANFRGSKGSMPGLFRKQGGMTLSRFREWAQENEYLPRDPENAPPTVSDDDALDLFYRMFANEEAVALGDVDANLQAKAEQDRKRAEDRLNADPAAAMQRERARAIGNQPAIEALADFDNGLLTAPGLQKRLDDAETYDESAVPFSRAPANQPGLLDDATPQERVESERQRRDDQRNGKAGSGRTDMASGDGDLFAGNRPDQSSLFSRTDKPQGIALNTLSRVVRSLFSGWTNAPTVRAVQSVSDVPADVRERARLEESEGTPEGFFDPQTETVWLIADAISTPARARWVAYHEVTGHYGIRGVVERIGKGAGSLRKAFAATRSNPTIDKLARAIAFDRGLSDAEQNVATEEALAELSAAEETGDWQHLADRYNVTVPASMRPGIRGAIDRFVQAIKRLFSIIAEGRTDAFTDADWRELVRGAGRYVRKKPEPKAEPEPENFDVDLEFDVDVDGETVKATGNAQRMLDLAQKRIDNLTRLAECIAA